MHVWWFELDRDPVELAQCASVLTPDELERVARFRFQRDADRALAARGLLRELLARYLGRPPAKLHFAYGPQRKPYLPDRPVHFNLSHSQGLGVCAVTLDQPVGVDVEVVRADIDHLGIAEQSFSKAERTALDRVSGAEAVRGFFRCWTLKEAYIKARGGGLSIPLDAFDVPLTVAVSDRPQEVVSRESVESAHEWFVRVLEADPRFAAAVAVRSPRWTVSQRHLDLS